MNKEIQKKIIYILMVIGLVWIYITYVPFLMDYYLLRPGMSFSEFYHLNILSEIFEFEGVLIALMIGFLFCLTWDCGVSFGVMSLGLFLLTHGSYVKYQNRKELLRLADFQLTEAAGMAAGYLKFEFDRYLVALLGGLLLFAAVGIGVETIRKKVFFAKEKTADSDNRTGDKKVFGRFARPTRKQVVFCVMRGVAALVFCGVIYLYTTQFVMARTSIENADNINSSYEDNDRFILYRFVKNDSLDVRKVENVEDSYDFLLSQEAVRDMEETKVKPNVIVIMNESWWNTDNIEPGTVVFSKDPMGPYKWLSKRCITGHLTSNVYGGGTISSEAEFLTGINTKYYVTSSTIYEETLDRKLPSLVDYFNALDYETIAIHPFYGDFYSRDKVYETMGFDEAIFDEDMENQEVFTRYISDDSLVEEIIAEYEEKGEEDNKFIWSVSVANHRKTLDYHLDEVEDYDYPISVDLKGAELEEEEIDTLVNYVNGIYKAGEAYEKLINYFAEKNEPVVVVMFGDHIPNFSVDTLELLGLSKKLDADVSDGTLLEGASEGLTAEQLGIVDDIDTLKRLYSVPVVMWSNFDLADEPEFDGESIYYLPQMILESTGLPDSEMSRMLKHQRSIFTANAREFVLDETGEQVLEYTDEQLETLNHSKVVIYDILFGEDEEEADDIWLPIGDGSQ